jgi:hypothetical protein
MTNGSVRVKRIRRSIIFHKSNALVLGARDRIITTSYATADTGTGDGLFQ